MAAISQRNIQMLIRGTFRTRFHEAFNATLAAALDLSTFDSRGAKVFQVKECHIKLIPYAGATVISATDTQYARQGDILYLSGVGDAGGATSITFSASFINSGALAAGANKKYVVSFLYMQAEDIFIELNRRVEP